MSAPATSLVLQAVWFAFAFAVRAGIQRRRTGDHGFRLSPEQLWSLRWFAHVAFVVALVLGAVAPALALGGGRGVTAPLGALDHRAVVGVGLALALLGIIGTFLAQLAMGDSWRVGVDASERTGLVDGGVFGVVRNPIFSAMLLTSVGLALLVPSVLGLAGLVILIGALEVQVRKVEEPYLRSVHGAAFDRYTAKAGRFVPAVGRTRA